jgi:hypothetical protein
MTTVHQLATHSIYSGVVYVLIGIAIASWEFKKYVKNEKVYSLNYYRLKLIVLMIFVGFIIIYEAL